MKQYFKKIVIVLCACIFQICPELFAQQIIQDTGPIILPVSGQPLFTMPQGTSLTYISGQSITLLPGVTIQVQSGQTFEAKISSSVISPAPSNPAYDDSMNWTTSRMYDENGNVIGEAKSFFDYYGNSLQTQWRDISRGHVLASQPIYDTYQRPVISTLPAPTNNGAFAYKADFVQNASGTAYNYQNFDTNSKLNAPEVVGKTTIGTLGWYYSANNTFEKYVPETGYPYSRSDFYNDGSGEGKRTAGVGDQLKMGSGHESQSITLPVVNELNNYIAVRNKFFAVDSVGSLPSALLNEAYQLVGVDPNGQKGISITDKSGKALMSARWLSTASSAWYAPANTVTLSPNQYTYTIDPASSTNSSYSYLEKITLVGEGTVRVFHSGGLVYTGIASGYSSPPNVGGAMTVKIESDKSFKVNYNGVSGSVSQTACSECDADYKGNAFHYFSLLKSSSITVAGGAYKIYDLITDLEVSGTTLPAGFYKIVPNNLTSDITLTYTNDFEDISYNFYNQLGQLVATIAPEGVKQLLQPNFNNITKKENIPFSTFYNYDASGHLVRVKVWEGGTTEYVYRKDGNIRFSQNSLQVANKSFSYTNYDQFGRAIESGEYVYGATGTNFASASASSTILESTAIDGGLASFASLKTDWVRTEYDVAAKDVSTVASGYAQDFTIGGVAYTQNVNSETWYSYDDRGQLTWKVQNITGLGAKTIDYTYDFNGNVLQVVYQKNVSAERFYHHYEYDLDKRLSAVYTSKDGINKTLEAKYYYYLHGPLKRVELADNLQGIDYTYTPQGWLKTINHPSGEAKDPGQDGNTNSFAADVFGMSMEYFNGDYTRTGSNIASVNPGSGYTPYYNGNIQALTWSNRQTTGGTASPLMSAYKYDAKYQLKESVQGAPNYIAGTFVGTNAYKETFTYKDAHGNIGALTRNNSAGALADNFSYTYGSNSNRLNAVSGYASYEYDVLGQMFRQNKGTGTDLYVKYDVTGKVTGVYADASYTTLKVSYTYDENGQRIKKEDKTAGLITWYVSGIDGATMAIYEKQGAGAINLMEQPIYGVDRLGTLFVQGSIRKYELKDHLGNVRAVLLRNKNGTNADIYSFKDYYAFGSKAQSGGTDDYRYDYQGQFAEKDKETDWNAFDARMYDGKIGRWSTIDPLGQFDSPYTGMGNSPLMYIDEDGRLVINAIGAVVGGIAGGVTSIVKQTWIDGKSFNDVNWKRVGLATASGALAGSGVGLITTVGIGIASEVGDQYLDQGKITNPNGVIAAGVVAGAGAIVSKGVHWGFSKIGVQAALRSGIFRPIARTMYYSNSSLRYSGEYYRYAMNQIGRNMKIFNESINGITGGLIDYRVTRKLKDSNFEINNNRAMFQMMNRLKPRIRYVEVELLMD